MSETPTTFEQAVDQVLSEARTLLIRKQRDYGPGNIMAFGELGVLVRANDKIERLKNLWKTGNLDDPQNEAADDTWFDLLNYGLIGLMVRRGIFGLPLAKEPRKSIIQLAAEGRL